MIREMISFMSYKKYILLLFNVNKLMSHEVAFNELIEKKKKKNTTWSNTMLDCERSVSRRTLFMDENSDRSH